MSSLNASSIQHTFARGNTQFAIELATQAAQRLYTAARIRSTLSRIGATLAGRRSTLLSLAGAAGAMQISGQREGGAQAIAISRIRGSESRSNEFDAHFRPLASHTRSRWIGIAIASMLGRPLPPIEVIQLGDDYFVRDGHHRVSVARALGQAEIDARVTVWLVHESPAQQRVTTESVTVIEAGAAAYAPAC
jgi:hypothetical protein